MDLVMFQIFIGFFIFGFLSSAASAASPDWDQAELQFNQNKLEWAYRVVYRVAADHKATREAIHEILDADGIKATLTQTKICERLQHRFYNSEALLLELRLLAADFGDDEISRVEDQVGEAGLQFQELRHAFCEDRNLSRSALSFHLAALDVELRHVIERIADLRMHAAPIHLTPKMIRSLTAAVATQKYTAHILSRWSSNGQKRQDVVILGEAHIKSQNISDLGFDATHNYSIVGLEGVTWMNNEMEDKYSKAAAGLKKVAGCKVGDQTAVFDSSVIHRVGIAAKKGILPNIFWLEADMPLDDDDKAKIAELSTKLEKAVQSFQSIDDLQSSLLGRILFAIIAKPKLDEMLDTQGGVSSVPSDQAAGSNLDGFLLEKRNMYMAKNLVEHLDADKSSATALIIVGANHGEGLAHILSTSFGFVPVVAPEIFSRTSDSFDSISLRSLVCGE